MKPKGLFTGTVKQPIKVTVKVHSIVNGDGVRLGSAPQSHCHMLGFVGYFDGHDDVTCEQAFSKKLLPKTVNYSSNKKVRLIVRSTYHKFQIIHILTISVLLTLQVQELL